MEKKSSTIFVKGDIVTYDIEYVKREKLDIDNPNIQAQIVREINDDGTILLGGFFEAIPSQYVLPIPLTVRLPSRFATMKSKALIIKKIFTLYLHLWTHWQNILSLNNFSPLTCNMFMRFSIG